MHGENCTGIRLPKPPCDDIHRSFGLRDAHSRLEPRQQIERCKRFVIQAVPAGRSLFFHGERNPEIGRLADRCPKELRRGHADDGVDRLAKLDGLAHRGRIVPEATHPPGIAHDGNRMASGRLVVGFRKCLSKKRPHTQHRKIAA